MRALVLLAALLLSVATAKPQGPHDQPIVSDSGSPRLVFVVEPDQREAVRAVVERRLAGRRASVAGSGENLIVELAAGEDVELVREIVGRRGHFDILAVDSLSDELVARVEADAAAGAQNIRVERAEWNVAGDPQPYGERFLRGPDAVSLRAYLERQPIDDAHRWFVLSDRDGARSLLARWPSTLPASFVRDVQRGARGLDLHVAEHGLPALRALTAGQQGGRMIVVLDDDVLVAPVVAGPIERSPILLVEMPHWRPAFAPILLGGELPARLVAR